MREITPDAPIWQATRANFDFGMSQHVQWRLRRCEFSSLAGVDGTVISVGGLAAVHFGWNQASLDSERLLGVLPEAAAIASSVMSYLVVAVGRLPGFRLDRARAAPVGARLMAAAAARPVGGIARPAVGKPPAPVTHYLFPLFHLVEIRHRQLLRSRSRIR
jgi:hypothetical protein